MRFTLSLMAAAMVGGSAITAQAAVWETKNEWNEAYEREFSQAIKSLPLNIFSNPQSKWKGLPTDCADAAYALRVIFAYDRKLPVKFRGHHGKFITNDMTDFDNAQPPAGSTEDVETFRVKRFIRHVNYYTDTITLVKDSYPVEINRLRVRPGTMFLNPKGGKDVPITHRSGHVYYVADVRHNGVVKYVSSTVPILVRDLMPRYGVTFAPMGETGGFRAWKWPHISDNEKQPGESLEQFTKRFGGWQPKGYRNFDLWSSWQNAVRAKIRIDTAETPEEDFQLQLENVRVMVKDRALVVKRAWEAYKKSGSQCMDQGGYDNWSTSTRDVRLQVELQYLHDSATKYVNATQGSWNWDTAGALQQFLRKLRFQVMDDDGRGRPVVLDFTDLWDAFHTEKVLAISEPEHSPLVRWGLETQKRWPCPQRAKAYVGGELVNTDGTPARGPRPPAQ
jgi:hypothetical protein